MAMAMQISSLQAAAGLPAWNGLKCKAGCACHSSTSVGVSLPARRTSHTVRAAATNGDSTNVSTTGQQALFASVSASAPPAPSSSSSPAVPVLVGAGVVAAAAFAYFAKAGGKSAAPIAEKAKEGANGALYAATPKRAAPAALATIAHYFPNAMQDESFVKACARELFQLGFSRDNCIALVNTCRDEVCRPLVNCIDKEFGLSFNISGLGGLVNCGKTGFKAGFSHSPEFPCETDGKPRERYVFFAFPHVSIGETGEVGSLLRRGRGKPSSACGALIAIKNDAKAGRDTDDVDDPEYCLLRKKVLSKPIAKNAGPDGPSLIGVTKAALQVITDDVEDLISKTVNPETADYAVITGVQIHSGNQIPGEPFKLERTVDYIAPGTMYAVIRGERHIMHCEVNQISTIKSINAEKVVASVAA